MLVRARVKPGNCYGGLGPGEVVEVHPSELTRVHWCLEKVEESAAARLAAAREKIDQLRAELDKAMAEAEAAGDELERLAKEEQERLADDLKRRGVLQAAAEPPPVSEAGAPIDDLKPPAEPPKPKKTKESR